MYPADRDAGSMPLSWTCHHQWFSKSTLHDRAALVHTATLATNPYQLFRLLFLASGTNAQPVCKSLFRYPVRSFTALLSLSTGVHKD